MFVQFQAGFMADDTYWIDGESRTSQKLLRIFLAASIIDSGGTLNVSRKALAELSDKCLSYRGFQIIAAPGEDHDMDLSLEWHK
jgi:hypothetical protein